MEANMTNTIKIKKKENLKGEDGYKVFSIRIKDDTVKKLDEIAKQSSQSRNHLINLFLEYGLDHYEIVD